MENTRPTKQEARKWAKALRSGKYKQTTGTMQNADGYCPLGVACDLFIPKERLELTRSGFIRGNSPECNQSFAPWWLQLIRYTKFNLEVVEFIFIDLTIPCLNDDEGYTFDMIADIIELEFIHFQPD